MRGFAGRSPATTSALHNLRVLTDLRENFGFDQVGLDAWCGRWLGDGLAVCKALVARHGGGTRFTVGNEPGLANIGLLPQIVSADRFGVDTTARPRLREIVAA